MFSFTENVTHLSKDLEEVKILESSQDSDHRATSSLGDEQKTDGRKYTHVRQDVSLLVLIICFRRGVYFTRPTCSNCTVF